MLSIRELIENAGSLSLTVDNARGHVGSVPPELGLSPKSTSGVIRSVSLDSHVSRKSRWESTPLLGKLRDDSTVASAEEVPSMSLNSMMRRGRFQRRASIDSCSRSSVSSQPLRAPVRQDSRLSMKSKAAVSELLDELELVTSVDLDLIGQEMQRTAVSDSSTARGSSERPNRSRRRLSLDSSTSPNLACKPLRAPVRQESQRMKSDRVGHDELDELEIVRSTDCDLVRKEKDATGLMLTSSWDGDVATIPNCKHVRVSGPAA